MQEEECLLKRTLLLHGKKFSTKCLHALALAKCVFDLIFKLIYLSQSKSYL